MKEAQNFRMKQSSSNMALFLFFLFLKCFINRISFYRKVAFIIRYQFFGKKLRSFRLFGIFQNNIIKYPLIAGSSYLDFMWHISSLK